MQLEMVDLNFFHSRIFLTSVNARPQAHRLASASSEFFYDLNLKILEILFCVMELKF